MTKQTRASAFMKPDAALTVPYPEAEELIRAYLHTFPHGGLKEYAQTEDAGLSYAALVSLKNNKLQRPAPLAVHRILRKLGIDTEVVKERKEQPEEPGKKPAFIHKFAFSDAKGLDAFKKAYNHHVHPSNEPAGPAPSGE
jgi:hypothetical protein